MKVAVLVAAKAVTVSHDDTSEARCRRRREFRGEGSNPYMRDQNPLSYH